MPEYRRNRVPGGTFFFTANLANRRSDLLVRDIETLRASVRSVRVKAPFYIDAWVILPDHIYCIWTLPAGDTDFSGRWRAIKIRFSRSFPDFQPKAPSPVPCRGRGIWQKRFWEHTIRDERDYRTHMDYVHFNLVKHGLEAHAADWPFSTFAKCVALGLYEPTWAFSNNGEDQTGFGERR